MKLWEVIKELTEDPTKMFESKADSRKERMTNTNGYPFFQRWVYGEEVEPSFMEEFALMDDDNWQLVRQPVTWQEAIQAWAAGGIVSVEVGGCKYLFADVRNPELTRRMIQFGTWYVED